MAFKNPFRGLYRIIAIALIGVMLFGLLTGCQTGHRNNAEYMEELSQLYTEPTIVVSSAAAKPGKRVEITLTMLNNPGVVGMMFSVLYDENAMSLERVIKGDALQETTFTAPKYLASGCKLLWDAEAVLPQDATNGIMVTLVFQMSETAAAGEYVVTLADPDVIDNDLQPVTVQIVDGRINVE